MKISINGKIVAAEEAKISIFDRGYLFGEGLFETMRSYQKKVPFLDKHLARMEWGATFINIPFLHPKEIENSINELIRMTGYESARIKVILTGMNEQTSRPQLPTDEMGINCVIICEKFSPLGDEDYDEGVELCVMHSIKNDPAPASNLKSTSWLTKMVARRELAEKSAFDGILLDALGYVTETTSGNLFWIKDRVLYTAPVSLGLLPGITRQVVIDLAKESGIEFKEKMIKPEELMLADEVFMTNSTCEVLPVTVIDGASIKDGEVGELTKDLAVSYHERIQDEIAD